MAATLSPEKILKSVSATWKDLGKQDPGVLRAHSLTLVAVADEGEDLSAMLETLAALMPEHPARTIVLRLGAGHPLAAEVTAQCWMPFGQRRQICAEQILITAAADSLEDVASVISPLTAPDLPVVLWCRSPRVAQSAAFGHLAAVTGKVVLDSAYWPDAAAAIAAIRAMAARAMPVADLSWTRLTPWRERLSQVFENRLYAARLPEISRVRVAYGGPTREAAARYMGAWVRNGLQAAGARPEVMLDMDSTVTGHFSMVELSGGSFRVELLRQEQRLVVRVNGLAHCTGLPHSTDCTLLREELRIVRRDPVFAQTLEAAVQQ